MPQDLQQKETRKIKQKGDKEDRVLEDNVLWL